MARSNATSFHDRRIGTNENKGLTGAIEGQASWHARCYIHKVILLRRFSGEIFGASTDLILEKITT